MPTPRNSLERLLENKLRWRDVPFIYIDISIHMPACCLSDGIYNFLLLEGIKWSAWLIRFIIFLRQNYRIVRIPFLQSKYSGTTGGKRERLEWKRCFLLYYYLYFSFPNLYIQFYLSRTQLFPLFSRERLRRKSIFYSLS